MKKGFRGYQLWIKSTSWADTDLTGNRNWSFSHYYFSNEASDDTLLLAIHDQLLIGGKFQHLADQVEALFQATQFGRPDVMRFQVIGYVLLPHSPRHQ